MRRAIVPLALATLACAGGPATEVAELPTYAAEPLAIVDMPAEERPQDVIFLADGTLAISNADSTRPEGGTLVPERAVRFRTVDGAAGAFADTPKSFNESAGPLALSPDGTRFARTVYDQIELVPVAGGPMTILPLRDPGRTTEALLGACSDPWQIVWSGATIAARCAIGPPVVLVDVVSAVRTTAIPTPDLGTYLHVSDLAVSPDGNTLLVLGQGGTYNEPEGWLQLQDMHTGAVRQRFQLQRPFDDVAMSPDGTKIAVSHPYFGLQIVDAADGHVLADYSYTPDQGDAGSGDVLWLPDGTIARGGRRHSISVHSGTDATLLGYFPAHANEPPPDMTPPADWPATLSSRNGSLALSPDGHTLASIERTDFSRAVRTWRLP